MNTKIRVAINGFGRIGRSFFRLAMTEPGIEVVAVNDLGDLRNLAYLLEYDSAQGYVDYDIEVADGWFTVNGQKITFTQEKDPTQLPWGDLDVQVVVEATGVFTDYEAAAQHLSAGAKHVVITAPAKGDPEPGVSATALVGINTDVIKTCAVTSNASCTTNAGAPLIAILDEGIGIEKALLNTVHGYTSTQSLVDGPSKKDFRRGRAAAVNMIPTSTGAAIATTEAYPALKDKFDGIAIRVPVISGSLADITFISKRPTTVEEVNAIMTTAARDPRWQGIFTITDEPVVSSDIIGSTYGSIADLGMTRVVDGNLVKVMAWYDNEMGYTATLVRHVLATASDTSE